MMALQKAYSQWRAACAAITSLRKPVDMPWRVPSVLARSIALSVLVVGIGASAAAYRLTSERVVADARAKFISTCKDVQQRFALAFNDQENVLRSLRAFFGHADAISYTDFIRFVSQMELTQRHPGVMTITYTRHNARTSAVNGGDARISDHADSDVSLHPSGSTEALQSVTYVHTVGDDAGPLNVQTRSVIHVGSFAASRDSGEVVLFRQGHSGTDAHHLGLRLALYRRDMSVDDVFARRRAFVGTVGVTFSLLESARQAVQHDLADRLLLRISLPPRRAETSSSQADGNSDSVLMDSRALSERTSERGSDKRTQATLHEELTTTIGGEQLLFDYAANAGDFAPPLYRDFPSLMLMLGVISSVLLSALLLSLLQSRDNLETAISRRTSQLDTANKQLREEVTRRLGVERELLTIAEDERKEIGRELHDNVGQRLTAVSFLAQSLLESLATKDSALSDQAHVIEKYLSEAISRIRMLAKAIYPISTGAEDLRDSIDELVREMRQVYGVACDVRWGGEIALADSNALHVYRIVQEAIRNAITHGNASAIHLAISAADGRPRIRIVDDGCGFEAADSHKLGGIGLQVMRHRCSMMGVDLSIASTAEGGAILSIG